MRVIQVHRGRWTVEAPQDPRDEYSVWAKADGAQPAFSFTGTRRELVALRTAITAAILAPKKVRRP